MPGFSDAAEPAVPHHSARFVLPSSRGTNSALRMFLISALISPARACRYRRFALALADEHARLAEKRVSVHTSL